MNTYLRILSFARPWHVLLPQYILYTVFYVVFSLVNVTAIIPLLDVLFNFVPTEVPPRPEFSFTIDYVTAAFSHYFGSVVAEYGRSGALMFVCLIVVISNFLANIFRFLSGLVTVYFRVNLIKNLRKGIYDKIVQLQLGYFAEHKKGDLVARIMNDVQEVENTVIHSLQVIFREPFLIIGYFAVLFSISVELTVYTLILIPLSGGIISLIGNRLKKHARRAQFALGAINSVVDETLSGMRVIKAFNGEKLMRGKFSKEVDDYARHNISMYSKYMLSSPISEFLGMTVVAGIMYLGGSVVLSGSSSLTASEFIGFIVLFAQIINPAKILSQAYSFINKGIAAGERVFGVMDELPTIKDEPGAQPIKEFNDSLVFNDVSFAYEKERVIRHLDLTVHKGKTLALVGPSGGGKSTIVDLIPRFYDPSAGQLMIDGEDIRAYKLYDLRGLMGIVTQESILFNDTIFNNIAFSKPEASEDEVIRAAKIANAHEFIMETPEGYQTIIGDRGTKLSGGQRQRLSIARAILKNPPILILDEATSALDSESERLVQDALLNLMKNRTSIVIAHRLSTIQHADEIVVIKKGEIVERGKHESLMDLGGLYKKLTQMQSV